MSWHIETNSMGKVVLICNDKGHPIARMVDDKDYANAALLAAAPDLLEVLNTILEYHTTSKPWNAKEGDVSGWIKSARTAIAKATNQTN